MATRDTVISFYNNILFRDPAESEIGPWVAAIDGGTPINDVRDEFINSLEAINVVDPIVRLYDGLLGRQAEKTGLDGNVDVFRTGVSLEAMAQSFLNSPEFAAKYGDISRGDFITLLYNNSLERQPEPEGFNFYLNSGLTYAQIAAAIVGSPESTAVNDLGQERLLEAYAAGGDGDGTQDLNNTPTPPEQVIVEREVIREVEVPGPTVFVPVDRPVPGPVVDAPDATITLNSPLRSPLSNANGDQYAGDGTTPADRFSTVSLDGFTVGIDVLPRQTDTAFGGGEYLARESSFDGTILNLTHVAPAGPQDTDNGSFQDVANRGANNQGLLFGSERLTFEEALEAGYRFEFKADADNTAAVNYTNTTFTAILDTSTGNLDFRNAAGQGFNDFKGTENVASETFQQNFVLANGVAGLTEGADFQNEYNVYAPDDSLLIGIREHLILGTPGYSPADQFI